MSKPKPPRSRLYFGELTLQEARGWMKAFGVKGRIGRVAVEKFFVPGEYRTSRRLSRSGARS